MNVTSFTPFSILLKFWVLMFYCYFLVAIYFYIKEKFVNWIKNKKQRNFKCQKAERFYTFGIFAF